MPTLSRLFPLSHLALLRHAHAPFWAQALALCALFAVAGVAVLDDYGVGRDEQLQREITIAGADYVLAVLEEPLSIPDRYYGLAFEMPLLLAERALGLQDTRHIYLSRHLLTHLFFIAGGFACGMLAYRMLGNRWIALLAMLMFLLHPRLYAHSFFNTKDIPFAAMLVIALYLTHRAFRRDTLGAFLLCGIGVGLAINLRVFALMLPPMILAMRGLDLWQAGRGERKRILATAWIFAGAAIATVYIIHPYYWENPLWFIEGARVASQHPNIVKTLFMGELYPSYAVPWNFIPVWFAITAPPVALALGAIGCAAVCWQAITRPLRALLDRETRFRILMLSCFMMPVAIVIILQTSIYNDWRQMYFLWAPFCLLVAVGLHAIVKIRMRRVFGEKLARLPGWVRGVGRLHIAPRAFVYCAAGIGLITTLTAMAALHPHQQVYFNALVDAKTPGALGNRYEMDYWFPAHRELLEYLLARYPDDTLRVGARRGKRNEFILPSSDRERIILTDSLDADFYLHRDYYHRRDTSGLPMFHNIQAYGSVIAYITAPNSDAAREYYRASYADAATNGTLLARANFDIYIHNGELRYLNADCEQPMANIDFIKIFAHVFPVNPADLPADYRERGFENRDFEGGAFFDGKCIAMRSLPDYPIARIRTGQRVNGEVIWRADIDLSARAAAQSVYESIAAGDYGQPVAQSDFDVYLRGNTLTYLKEPCAPGDTTARFLLHITPANPADLSAANREHGFANLDFQFADHGARIDGKCVIERQLPDYAIERIRTGQFIRGEGAIWSIEFAAGR